MSGVWNLEGQRAGYSRDRWDGHWTRRGHTHGTGFLGPWAPARTGWILLAARGPLPGVFRKCALFPYVFPPVYRLIGTFKRFQRPLLAVLDSVPFTSPLTAFCRASLSIFRLHVASTYCASSSAISIAIIHVSLLATSACLTEAVVLHGFPHSSFAPRTGLRLHGSG